MSIRKTNGIIYEEALLIHSAQTGLIHYLEPEATFQLIERGSMLA